MNVYGSLAGPVDQPVWTIKFGNEAEMNRWYELLNQAINAN